MFIKDLQRRKLELTKTRLSERKKYTENDPIELEGPNYYLELSDLAKTYSKGRVWIRAEKKVIGWARKVFTHIIEYESDRPCIGCREFSPATFKKILKAAGICERP